MCESKEMKTGIEKRHLSQSTKMAFFCFVSERTLDGETAGKIKGVRPIHIWWRRTPIFAICGDTASPKLAKKLRTEKQTSPLHLLNMAEQTEHLGRAE